MERGSGLFEADVLLPAQFYANFRQNTGATAERRLMMAVLQDALECFRKHAFSSDQRSQQIFREAQDWIFTTDRQWCYSFENICDALGLDPNYVRGGLQRWYARAQGNGGQERVSSLPRRSQRGR